MDVNCVFACVDLIMTTHLLSTSLTADKVDAIAEVIQSRVVSWVIVFVIGDVHVLYNNHIDVLSLAF